MSAVSDHLLLVGIRARLRAGEDTATIAADLGIDEARAYRLLHVALAVEAEGRRAAS